jgi:hypothetical protein
MRIPRGDGSPVPRGGWLQGAPGIVPGTSRRPARG